MAWDLHLTRSDSPALESDMARQDQDPIAAVQAALAQHPRLGRSAELDIHLASGAVTLDGTLTDVAARRLIPRIAAAASGIGIRDRLRLAIAAPRDDAAIARDLERALRTEPLFAGYGIAPTPAARDAIKVDVHDGVARLEGRVEGLHRRRLAEVLAWWTPGCADVDNRLQVQPPEQDSDAAIKEALRLVLERDRRVDAARIAVRTRDRVVMLIGVVPEEEQKTAAAQDAWFIAGVHGVENRIRVFDHAALDRSADEASRQSFPASDAPSITPIVGVGGTARSP